MRILRTTLAVASLTLALLAFPSASASHEVCGHDNQAVYEDVLDTLGGDRQCGTLTDPCFQDSSCPPSCGGGTDSVVTWLVGPIYCVAAVGATAPCQGPNEYVHEDVRDTLGGDVQCGSLTDPCFQSGGCGGCGPDLLEWVVGPIYCAASAGAAFTCDTGNMYVHEDVEDTMENPKRPACGSLHDPCFADGSSCYGCGPDVLEWVVGPIYCV